MFGSDRKSENSNDNRVHLTKKLIVQKYGGATLADSAKIKAVANRILEQSQVNSLIVIVSAMGKTTNNLIEMANQVAAHPNRRELDMLLSTGERISMSLMSLALNDIGCPAVSFTGSQAGILTDESHSNAFITDVKAFRVAEALEQNKVAILAGFQGVSPKTKEITTLGRGGSDTTAVAMAAAFQAERCEILKDVAGVFSADPKLVETAKPIFELNYDQLLEMTFWGAKVLHYRSVELAKAKDVFLYIGPASDKLSDGTVVKKGLAMFETCKALSVNSHERVLRLTSELASENILSDLNRKLSALQIPTPQILEIKSVNEQNLLQLSLTGPSEILNAIEVGFSNDADFKLDKEALSSVSLTCSGVTSIELHEQVLQKLASKKISPLQISVSAMSVNVFVKSPDRENTIKALHELI